MQHAANVLHEPHRVNDASDDYPQAAHLSQALLERRSSAGSSLLSAVRQRAVNEQSICAILLNNPAHGLVICDAVDVIRLIPVFASALGVSRAEATYRVRLVVSGRLVAVGVVVRVGIGVCAVQPHAWEEC